MSWLSNATGINIDLTPRNPASEMAGVMQPFSDYAAASRAAEDARIAKEKSDADALAAKNDAGKKAALQRSGGGPVAMAQGTGTSLTNDANWYTQSQNEYGMYSDGTAASGAPNPWASAAGAQAAQNQGANADASSAYPTMQNDYGLGQATATPGSSSNPGFGTTDISVTVPDSGSRGFNPWSLQGEALSRR